MSRFNLEFAGVKASSETSAPSFPLKCCLSIKQMPITYTSHPLTASSNGIFIPAQVSEQSKVGPLFRGSAWPFDYSQKYFLKIFRASNRPSEAKRFLDSSQSEHFKTPLGSMSQSQNKIGCRRWTLALRLFSSNTILAWAGGRGAVPTKREQ